MKEQPIKIEIVVICRYHNNIMDNRLNKKVDAYLAEFKESIRSKSNELSFSEVDKICDLMEFIYEYERLSFNKEDINKRQRIKNCIPDTNRCNAKIADGNQCTRQRKDNCIYCGTHEKGCPHGVVNESSQKNMYTNHEVFVEEINGICQHLDKHGNIYKTEDIMYNKENPNIIGQYMVDSVGKYNLQFNENNL